MTKCLSILSQWGTPWAEREVFLLRIPSPRMNPSKETLGLAMGLEKDSILFYLGIQDLIPAQSGRYRIVEIIEKERRHVIQL